MKDLILVVDDEKDLRDVLKLYLETAGYTVLEAENGIEAIELISKSEVSLMILDIMMPKMDGFELIKKLGEERNFPIIFLSARTKVQDKILGLNLGADDYIEKPFDPGEVLARVMASLRRVKKENIREIKNGNLIWNTEERFIYKDGEKLDLTAKEYKLLSLLMKRPGKVFTKQEIYEFLWEESYYNDDDNTIMVHISKLREKIEENPRGPKKIKTIRGIGYMLEKINEDE
ncbi:response regulator transcription factor [Microaceticoccus formicicus]|uniref:response regulator transcription factor n=1 Tax=Microaceticoccus formicicus TaxID=3118105 RepID=UPI003CD011E6|nr:response regulator transcription factor [Peptoniphilaceae bacterium AMB_02]